MPTHFCSIPNRLKQQFTRVRRTYGTGRDSYGDATFTESQTAGFRGFFQSNPTPGQVVIIAGKEIQYDGVVYTGATVAVGEDDVLLFGSSTATAISTRYHVHGITEAYDGAEVEHKEIYVSQEVR